MVADLVLGVDCSTTASKVVAWNRHGVPVAEARAPLTLLSPHPGWGEQDAEQWWDASAAALRDRLRSLTGRDVAVVVSDTLGRPWRVGQVDQASGVAGLAPLRDSRGTHDAHGHLL